MAALVPLTHRHWISFHGEPPPYRVKGVAVVDDEKVYAIGGVGFQQGWIYVFMDMVPEAQRYPKLLLKGGKKVIEIGRQIGLPMIATQNEEMESSERFLRRLGFEQDDGVWMQ